MIFVIRSNIKYNYFVIMLEAKCDIKLIPEFDGLASRLSVV